VSDCSTKDRRARQAPQLHSIRLRFSVHKAPPTTEAHHKVGAVRVGVVQRVEEVGGGRGQQVAYVLLYGIDGLRVGWEVGGGVRDELHSVVRCNSLCHRPWRRQPGTHSTHSTCSTDHRQCTCP